MNKIFSNHLIHESSHYLLQHAHNPVNWFTWGNMAFQKSREENKPILVSIGYSACHWCHVMERESFENVKIADFMNTHFVNVKIDREERPDLDQLYMQACQILTGSGGWPLNVFLTPELKPFSAGTYFPPEPKFNKPSWLQVLIYIHDTFINNRQKVNDQANLLTQHIQDSIQIPSESIITTNHYITERENISLTKNITSTFDFINGGIGTAPKFPSSMLLLYLLRKNYLQGDMADKVDEDYIQLSLIKMATGGIFDHLGGGFARYTVDEKWRVPHFEKMLYDNALLLKLYSEAYHISKNPFYKKVIEKTADFIEKEMQAKEGGFYCAFDADSEGIEGKYYTWSKAEIAEILGEFDATFFCNQYNLTEGGNWEETNILFKNNQTEITAAESTRLENLEKILLQHRAQRVPPLLDTKKILSWNALMCEAFLSAFKSTRHEKYKELAEKSITYILSSYIQNEKELHHVLQNEKAKYDGNLEDYAALIHLLIENFQICSDYKSLDRAITITEYVIENFSDEQQIFFYFTPIHQKDIPIRTIEIYDHAVPSGNSMMFVNLKKLASIFPEKNFGERADKMFFSIKGKILKFPTSFGNWLLGSLIEQFPFYEIVLSGAEDKTLFQQLIFHYQPNQILITDFYNNNSSLQILSNKWKSHETNIFICVNQHCKKPVKSFEEYLENIRML